MDYEEKDESPSAGFDNCDLPAELRNCKNCKLFSMRKPDSDSDLPYCRYLKQHIYRITVCKFYTYWREQYGDFKKKFGKQKRIRRPRDIKWRFN